MKNYSFKRTWLHQARRNVVAVEQVGVKDLAQVCATTFKTRACVNAVGFATFHIVPVILHARARRPRILMVRMFWLASRCLDSRANLSCNCRAQAKDHRIEEMTTMHPHLQKAHPRRLLMRPQCRTNHLCCGIPMHLSVILP